MFLCWDKFQFKYWSVIKKIVHVRISYRYCDSAILYLQKRDKVPGHHVLKSINFKFCDFCKKLVNLFDRAQKKLFVSWHRKRRHCPKDKHFKNYRIYKIYIKTICCAFLNLIMAMNQSKSYKIYFISFSLFILLHFQRYVSHNDV